MASFSAPPSFVSRSLAASSSRADRVVIARRVRAVVLACILLLAAGSAAAQHRSLSHFDVSGVEQALLKQIESPFFEKASAVRSAAPWQHRLNAPARLFAIQSATAGKAGRALPVRESYGVEIDPQGRLMMDVLIELKFAAGPNALADLEPLGLTPGARVGRILTARVPASAAQALADHPAVRFVELARRRSLSNDAARIETKAEVAYQGTGLPRPFRGSGVVVGVIDSGIDFTHPDFSDDDGTRIQYLLEFTEGGGQNEWTKAQIDASPGTVTQRDGNGGGGHGTHVTGTAAGGGRVNPALRGVAPESDIIFVKGIRSPESVGSFTDTDVINGSDYIFQKSAELGKPAVINLSLAGHGGPLDGSSLYEQALSDLAGPGKIILAAAGNAGFDFIHAGGQLQSGAMHATALTPSNTDFSHAEMWYDPGAVTQVGIALLTIENNEVVLKDQTPMVPVGQTIGVDGQGQLAPVPLQANEQTIGYVAIDAVTTADPRNGDGHAFFIITRNDDVNADISQGIWLVLATGGSAGRMDTWAGGGHFFDGSLGFNDIREVPGTTDMTIGSPGTALKTISIGSYVTGNSWIDIDGSEQDWLNPNPDHDPDSGPVIPTIGQRSYFSSKGPLRDGRTAPDIGAPGEFIFSAMSSHLTEGEGYQRRSVLEGGQYLGMQGTSMASPHATGIVALMLEADPTLDTGEVRQILSETARTDTHTGSVPNNQFGAGKIDAQAAVLRTLEQSGSGSAVAQVSVDELTIEVRPGESTSTSFDLSNAGTASLSFTAAADLTSTPGKSSARTAALPRGHSSGATLSGFTASTTRTLSASRGSGAFSDRGLRTGPAALGSGSGSPGTSPGSPGSAATAAKAGALGEDVLFLDDGNETPDNFLGFGDGSEFYWVNEFALGEDFELDEIHVFMRTESATDVSVWLAVYNEALEELTSGVVPASLSPDGQWYTAPLPSPINFSAGETFYLEVGTSDVEFPAGADAAASVAGRSYYYDPESEEYVSIATVDGFADGAFLIRAGGTIDSGGGGTNQSPVATAQVSPASVEVGKTVTFNASQSSDPDGQIATYAWTFGDGGTSTETVATHAYQTPGSYTYVLTVTDDAGATGQTSGIVSVSAPSSRFTLDPSSGAVAAGAAQTINVSFDATELAEGNYTGQLSVQTNGGNFSIPISVLVATNVAAEDDALPGTFALHQNYPNPFNPSTSVRFELPKAAEVRLEVFDVLGRRLAVLIDGDQLPRGAHEARLDAAGWSSGVYLYRLDAGAFSQTRRMTLMK